MMNIIVNIVFAILGTIFAVWSRSLWCLRCGWLFHQEPTPTKLLLFRLTGVIIAVIGLTLALCEFL